MLDALKLENIIISNEDILVQKITSMKSSGALSSLHVLSDYDSTLTKRFSNGEKIHGSFSLLRKPGLLSADYPAKDAAMFEHYHPIELNLEMPLEERMRHMQEWWEKHLQLLIDSGLTSETLNAVVNTNDTSFRDYTKDFFHFLSAKNIPLLILSAGMGDFITGFLKKANLLTKNVHIVSNFFDFNEQGDLIGFKDLIVHTNNKSESQLSKTPFGEEIKERKNVLLIGDHLGDLDMSEGVPHETIIRVGFLNDKVDELMPIFKEKFDIIILNDGSFEVINNLLQLLEYAE